MLYIIYIQYSIYIYMCFVFYFISIFVFLFFVLFFLSPKAWFQAVRFSVSGRKCPSSPELVEACRVCQPMHVLSFVGGRLGCKIVFWFFLNALVHKKDVKPFFFFFYEKKKAGESRVFKKIISRLVIIPMCH